MVNVQPNGWIWSIRTNVNVVIDSKWTHHVSFDNIVTHY
jgi:hypothetical protein